MRVIRVASAALLGAAALAVTAPAALADDGNHNITSFGFTVSPSTVAPGGTVTLNATGCEVPSVTVSSGVFDTVTLEEGHSATARVDDDAKPGAEYDVTFDCKGEKGTTPLTIRSGSGGHDDRTDPTMPGNGVRAGAGGSFSGMGPGEIGAGSALVAGALGLGVYKMRRRADSGA
ncbi:hypothetical protein AB0N93_21865 [Streptomyces sp. NPDC091267]|uniref:hypothetical protein n=1 Tax=Streptomyces sp. NPDC091267 TaxID=3155195 RepID=UPI00343E606F